MWTAVLFVSNAGLGVRTGRNEPCLRRVDSDLLSRSGSGARPTRSVPDPCFSNSRDRALLSKRHREIGKFVSDEQAYSAAICNSVSGRTISRKAESALDTYPSVRRMNTVCT